MRVLLDECLPRQLATRLHFAYQQHLRNARLGVVVVAAPSNRLDDLLVHRDELAAVIGMVSPGEVRIVGGD